MLAAWPGIADVSIIVATYLRRKLEFKDLAEIEPSHFFDPIGVMAKDGLVEAPRFPQSAFYYRKNKGGLRDTILFIGEDQPVSKNYDMANCIIDVARRFEVTRIYTCAAALTRIHHSESPRVWGVVTNPKVARELKKYNLVQTGSLQIAGLNGLLLGVAKERGIDGVCLLGEVPTYATQIQNPIAALAIVKVLTRMLDVEVDTRELAELATEAGEKMKEVASKAIGEYIDYFTTPIWESGEDDEEEE
jgi:proteasome assembly chaperone (PAC2) family protein